MSLEAPAATGRLETEAPAHATPRARIIALPYADIAICVLLFVAAIIPRAAWVAHNDRPPQGLNDPTLYVFFGDGIANGDGYQNYTTGDPVAYYPVGYPAMLGALKKGGDVFGWGRSTFSIKMMNGVVGAMTTVLVFLLASRVFDRRVGAGAGLLHAVFPSQVFYTGVVLSETQFTFLFLGALLILAWRPWSRDGMPYWQLFAAGLALSAATMTRGIALAFPLLLFAIWFFYLHSKKRALLQTLVMFAGIAVLVGPWTVRNIAAYDTFVGPSTNLGDDLCIGNYLGADGRFTLSGPCFEGFENKTGKELEIGRNRHGLKVAARDVAQHPLRMPKLLYLKAYWLLSVDDDGLWAAESYGHDWFLDHPLREILSFAANAIYYATGALVIAGALAFALARDVRRLFLLLAMLYVIAVPLAFFGDPRFHFPAIPLAIIIATWTLLTLWRHRHVLNAPGGEAPPPAVPPDFAGAAP